MRRARVGRVRQHRGRRVARRQRRAAVLPTPRSHRQPRHAARHRAPGGRARAHPAGAAPPAGGHHVRVLRRGGRAGGGGPHGEGGDGDGQRPCRGAQRPQRAVRHSEGGRLRGGPRGGDAVPPDRHGDDAGSHGRPQDGAQGLGAGAQRRAGAAPLRRGGGSQPRLWAARQGRPPQERYGAGGRGRRVRGRGCGGGGGGCPQ
mmetsp:Transcript_30221/g.75029  ORF Transcript_30221/g.75029 Transcript_30221/m.75029 type:complete len:202 (-) Transcript_30221:71-676(-)